MVGEDVGWGTLYLYELAGKCVYLYVGRGIDGWTKGARAINGRTKDVVPPIPFFQLCQILNIKLKTGLV